MCNRNRSYVFKGIKKILNERKSNWLRCFYRLYNLYKLSVYLVAINLFSQCMQLNVNFKNQIFKQVLSSSWDARPFGQNRHGSKRGLRGLLCPFLVGQLGPHLTQCGLGWGLHPYQVASWSIQLFGHNTHGPKMGALPLWGVAGSPSNTMWPGLRPTSIPSGILIHPAVWPFGHDRHGPKTVEGWRLLCPFLEGQLVPDLTQCGLGRGLPPYQVVCWSIQPFGCNRHGLKIGGLCPFWGESVVPI